MKLVNTTWRLTLLLGLVGIGLSLLSSGCEFPPVEFSAAPARGPAALRVRFSAPLLTDGLIDINYHWDLGDGSTASGPNPLHIYKKSGTYTVRVAATIGEETFTRTARRCIVVTDNEVLIWNQLALQAIADNNWMTPQAARGLAILHGAIYDAINTADREGEVYFSVPTARPGAAKEAAAAQAAHDVLTELFPAAAAAFDARLAFSLGDLPDGPATADGIALGQEVAEDFLAWRAGDGSEMTIGRPYLGGINPGQWRPTPPDFLPGRSEIWRVVAPFALISARQFLPRPPLAPDSAQYAADFEEVKAIGSNTSLVRTREQSAAAYFWMETPGSIGEAGRMNLVALQAAEAHGLDLFAAARLFALVNIAMADAAIAGIDCKYYYGAGRPITAIQEADRDGNPDTAADPDWDSYLVAPELPEYISTSSALTQAAAEVLVRFFGSEDADLNLPSYHDPAVNRYYRSFEEVAEEAGLSRIWGGIGFRFGHSAGAELGQDIGAYVFENYLRPL